MQLTFNRLALLTLTGCALLAPAAHAAQPYTDGDLILAFRADANPASSYLYNLGPAINFTSAVNPSALTLGIGQDLVNTFGASWFTRTDLHWSVVGVQSTASANFGKNTIFLSAPHDGALTAGIASSIPWDRPSAFGAQGPGNAIFAMANRYKLGSDGTTSIESSLNNFGLTQPNGETNSYASYTPGGPNTVGAAFFGSFVNNGIEASFGGGTAAAALDFYDVRTSSTSGLAAAFAGNFTINNSGNVGFAPEIPEPASAAVFGAGALALTLRRRRANAR